MFTFAAIRLAAFTAILIFAGLFGSFLHGYVPEAQKVREFRDVYVESSERVYGVNIAPGGSRSYFKKNAYMIVTEHRGLQEVFREKNTRQPYNTYTVEGALREGRSFVGFCGEHVKVRFAKLCSNMSSSYLFNYCYPESMI